jgi:thiamine-monophosphate kinase
MSWSEDSLHRWLVREFGGARRNGAIGNDAAVLGSVRGAVAICADQCIEGVHFEAKTPARAAGAKAASRALSDLAATAAEPLALVLALAAPSSASERRLRDAIAGVGARARDYGARLVGGDISRTSGPFALAVTALGGAPRGTPPGRDRARAGDVVVLTGAVGGSGLGRHLRIEPRLREGRWLHERGARAMMDVSDGLAWDLFRLARASGVRIVLENVPIHSDAVRQARSSGRTPLWHALSDGEDHELVATLPRRSLDRVLAEAPRRSPGLCVIGRVREGSGLWIQTEKGPARRWNGKGGWRHGEK